MHLMELMDEAGRPKRGRLVAALLLKNTPGFDAPMRALTRIAPERIEGRASEEPKPRRAGASQCLLCVYSGEEDTPMLASRGDGASRPGAYFRAE